jgi:hypothetical protein
MTIYRLYSDMCYLPLKIQGVLLMKIWSLKEGIRRIVVVATTAVIVTFLLLFFELGKKGVYFTFLQIRTYVSWYHVCSNSLY